MAKDREKIEGKASEPVANCGQLPEVIDIKPMIRVIRGQQVIIDRDLALLYGVETRVLNQAVKRNSERFPDDFMFQLSKEDVEILKSQNVTSSWGGDRRLPYAFTEQGIAMLSSVLKSQTAIDVNIRIMPKGNDLGKKPVRDIISGRKKTDWPRRRSQYPFQYHLTGTGVSAYWYCSTTKVKLQYQLSGIDYGTHRVSSTYWSKSMEEFAPTCSSTYLMMSCSSGESNISPLLRLKYWLRPKCSTSVAMNRLYCSGYIFFWKPVKPLANLTGLSST